VSRDVCDGATGTPVSIRSSKGALKSISLSPKRLSGSGVLLLPVIGDRLYILDGKIETGDQERQV
jgi:hypothetical protein